MNIGILTMNYKKNYGGILQTYGLSEYLKSLGHNVKIINYQNSGKQSFHSILSRIDSLLIKFISKKKALIPKENLSKQYLQNFIDFRNDYLDYTEEVNENCISKYNKFFDVIIIGSDQIWNGVNSNKLIYYFDWDYSGKKIAYAACTILQESPFFQKKKISKLLNKFNHISVRDENTADYVYKHALIKPQIVVDPSCLWDYQEFISKPPLNKPYILTYILSNEINGGNDKAIKIIKEYIGDYTVVSLNIPSVSVISKSIADIFINDATPQEWVNYFYHASFIFTDSFHGIMFSLKFKKPFIGYMKEGQRKSRLQDLINRFELKNIISNINQISDLLSEETFNYSKIDQILDREIQSSKSFIEKSIND